MKPRLFLFGLLLLAGRTAAGQDLTPKPTDRERDRAVDTFQRLDSGNRPKSNEVTVILDDVPPPIPPPEKPAEPADKAVDPATAPATDKGAPAGSPVLVTGKPPEDAHLVTEEPPPPPEKPEKGVTVKVVDVQGGKGGPIDASQIKLLFPFTPKPLTPPPPGWTFDPTAGAPPFTKQVELAPGTKISLNIRPHVLVPVADGKETFNVNEPGFDPALGYNQPGTVGTILSKAVTQLDEDSKNLGEAIDRLEQLLASMPAPAPEPAPPVAQPVREAAPIKKPR
ncbi:hypothetical protein KBB96_02800 [Luteolibacter ambystomatis]|uniref:Uncharacterized protein n=1 Tax=Luteolibacter ambystomatis TaxID=2824561 RepID=A0A975J0L7_9BACT|nr:hypothetical protein [Luteolibacter ambystomatis]QUE51826.1 hypothetical protein KBB96_02800 [Luteolibacter ambystomatis]